MSCYVIMLFPPAPSPGSHSLWPGEPGDDGAGCGRQWAGHSGAPQVSAVLCAVSAGYFYYAVTLCSSGAEPGKLPQTGELMF